MGLLLDTATLNASERHFRMVMRADMRMLSRSWVALRAKESDRRHSITPEKWTSLLLNHTSMRLVGWSALMLGRFVGCRVTWALLIARTRIRSPCAVREDLLIVPTAVERFMRPSCFYQYASCVQCLSTLARRYLCVSSTLSMSGGMGFSHKPMSSLFGFCKF
jgi:hypothetical protein